MRFKKIKDKRRQEADDKLKRAKKAITVAENKAKNALRDRGVQARKDEKARLAFLKANSGLVGVEIPDSMWVPIRDPQKNPTAAEKEALRANQSLYDAAPNVRNENGMRAAQTTLRISQPFLSTLLSWTENDSSKYSRGLF
jgi:hypothetical protein